MRPHATPATLTTPAGEHRLRAFITEGLDMITDLFAIVLFCAAVLVVSICAINING